MNLSTKVQTAQRDSELQYALHDLQGALVRLAAPATRWKPPALVAGSICGLGHALLRADEKLLTQAWLSGSNPRSMLLKRLRLANDHNSFLIVFLFSFVFYGGFYQVF